MLTRVFVKMHTTFTEMPYDKKDRFAVQKEIH